MSFDYKLRVIQNGTIVGELTDFLDLNYRVVINRAGKLSFVLGRKNLPFDFEVDTILEVYRANKFYDVSWYRDFTALAQDFRIYYSGLAYRMDITGSGLNSLLDRRIINWPAGRTDRSAFISKPVETVMKALVFYNLGEGALLAGGRKRTGFLDGFQVEVDQERGQKITYYCHGKNLLEALNELALIGGDDFEVQYSGGTYEFLYHPGQLGEDRTATQLFSLERGNMGNPVYEKITSTEKTVAAVWGQGAETERDYETVLGDNFSVANDREVYVDAREVPLGDSAGLTAKGQAWMKTLKAIQTFSFNVLQTPASVYGKHYFLGDRVSASFEGIDAQPKLTEATIGFGRQQEVIDIGMDTRL